MAVNDRHHLALIFYFVPAAENKVLIRGVCNVLAWKVPMPPLNHSNQPATLFRRFSLSVLQDLSPQLV
jgi:hypothetical protein